MNSLRCFKTLSLARNPRSAVFSPGTRRPRRPLTHWVCLPKFSPCHSSIQTPVSLRKTLSPHIAYKAPRDLPPLGGTSALCPPGSSLPWHSVASSPKGTAPQGSTWPPPPPFKSVPCHLFGEPSPLSPPPHAPAPPGPLPSPWLWPVPLFLRAHGHTRGVTYSDVCLAREDTPHKGSAAPTGEALIICRMKGVNGEGEGKRSRSTGVRERSPGQAAPSPPCTSSGCISP